MEKTAKAVHAGGLMFFDATWLQYSLVIAIPRNLMLPGL